MNGYLTTFLASARFDLLHVFTFILKKINFHAISSSLCKHYLFASSFNSHYYLCWGVVSTYFELLTKIYIIKHLTFLAACVIGALCLIFIETQLFNFHLINL